MSDATVETLPQGFIQQQFLNWLSIACARKICVSIVLMLMLKCLFM